MLLRRNSIWKLLECNLQIRGDAYGNGNQSKTVEVFLFCRKIQKESEVYEENGKNVQLD